MSEFIRLMEEQLERARDKHKIAIRCPHEALGVIREEYVEFEREVFRQVPHRQALLRELLHVAAMCQRAAEDLALSSRP